tara:strand:- start:85 stop:282 length:198 start_codon:yes stop_codon:yes gene_type:complete
MKYLFCGAGGFIEGHLVKDLMNEGHDVVCADIKPQKFWFQLFKKTKIIHWIDNHIKMGENTTKFT